MDSIILAAPTLLSSLTMFFFIYFLAYMVIFRNWDPNQRKQASSSFMSSTHGTPAVVFSNCALLNTLNSQPFASPNSKLQDRVLEFSLGHFLMDLVHYPVFFPNDILFILHHLATLNVLATCRYIVHQGAYGILVILILAEVTSPCQNIWTITRFRKAVDPTAARLHEVLSPIFLVFYSVVRGVLGPLLMVKIKTQYLTACKIRDIRNIRT